MVTQYPLHSLLGFTQLLLRCVRLPLAPKNAVHLQSHHDHGAESHRVEGDRVVVRAIVGHSRKATPAAGRLQAKGVQLWL